MPPFFLLHTVRTTTYIATSTFHPCLRYLSCADINLSIYFQISSVLRPLSVPDMPCSAKADDTFGPAVAQCRENFDFTLLFEQTILTIAPAALFLLCVPVRIIRLYRRSMKTQPSILHQLKLVNYAPNSIILQCQIVAEPSLCRRPCLPLPL